jgi:hypothetical protein
MVVSCPPSRRATTSSHGLSVNLNLPKTIFFGRDGPPEFFFLSVKRCLKRFDLGFHGLAPMGQGELFLF